MEYDRNEYEHMPCPWQGASCELGNVAHLKFVGCKIIHFSERLVDTFFLKTLSRLEIPNWVVPD